MRRIYPKYIERRSRSNPECGKARRWTDKLFSFVAFLLIMFLLNWALGCAVTAPVSERELYDNLDCKAHPDDVRCELYFPEEGPELDDTEPEVE